MFFTTSTEIAERYHDSFIQKIVQLRRYNISQEIQQRLSFFPNMTLSDKFQQVARLKAWLDSFRPLPPTVVAELKKLYDVRFTYNSNAIEGNTLTQSETALVLENGITIGGKTLREHLEVIGHKDAIDLNRQADYLQSLFPSGQVIKEIGSGLNYKPKGLQTILGQILSGDVEQVVCSYKDRLARFGIEIIDYICNQNNTKLVESVY